MSHAVTCAARRRILPAPGSGVQQQLMMCCARPRAATCCNVPGGRAKAVCALSRVRSFTRGRGFLQMYADRKTKTQERRQERSTVSFIVPRNPSAYLETRGFAGVGHLLPVTDCFTSIRGAGEWRVAECARGPGKSHTDTQSMTARRAPVQVRSAAHQFSITLETTWGPELMFVHGVQLSPQYNGPNADAS
eukprot:scaffold83908_cov63-Phaeocystis_antarctica.AAC.1